MGRSLRYLLIGSALLCALASPALAQNYKVKDALGVTITMCSQLVSGANATCQVQVDVNLAPSGVAAVPFSLTSASATGSFTPKAGRIFHIAGFSGTGSAVCYVERQLDGVHWTPLTVSAGGVTTFMQQITYTGAAFSEDLVETQANVPYRFDCGASLGSYTSGTVAGTFTQ